MERCASISGEVCISYQEGCAVISATFVHHCWKLSYVAIGSQLLTACELKRERLGQRLALVLFLTLQNLSVSSPRSVSQPSSL